MPQVVRNRLALLPVSSPSNEEVDQTTDTMSADGTLGERPVFNARAAVAAGIFYDWALNLRKQQLGACLTAKERLDASILFSGKISPFADEAVIGYQ